MAAVQMEGPGRDMLECPRCNGEGVAYEHSRDPFDVGASVCPRCDGSGRTPCDHCGERADHLTTHAQPVCSECDSPPESHDHPMGGMGHRIDYADRLGR